MEVNYLLVLVTTAIASFVILFLSWKKRKGLRDNAKDEVKSEYNAEEYRDDEQRL